MDIKSGIFLLLSLFLFVCVYIRDNSRTIPTDENGRELVKRNADAGEKENLKLKVKAGDVEESVNITVSVDRLMIPGSWKKNLKKRQKIWSRLFWETMKIRMMCARI